MVLNYQVYQILKLKGEKFMSAKVKLISFISAFVLVLGIMIIGVLSAEQVQVNIGGSVSFNATNVYAKVSGNISGAETGNKTFSTLTYSAEETTGDESDWTNLALEFAETPDPIIITITVENLSTQRTLTVNLENTLQGEGLDIAVTSESDSYTSGTNVELPVSTGDGSSTTTFTLTLTVADPNEDLTNVTFGYTLNMFDESVAPALPTPASSFTFSYSGADHTASITKFVGSETEVIIPSTIENNGTTYKVTAIANGKYGELGAFYDSNITSIVIPDTVTSIGSSAFYSCDSLTSITIPDSVTRIGSYAFNGCSGLTSITIPSRVTSISERAFYDCYALAEVYNYSPSITVKLGETSSSNNGYLGHYAKVVYNASDLTGEKPETRITVVDNVQYYDYGDNFIALAPISRNVTIVSLDSRTTEINGSAFSDSSLTSITIPSSVTSIGNSAFNGCRSLTSITIPEGVTSIGTSAFYDCSSLTSITIPEGVTSIGGSAFYGCRSLTSITIPEGVTSIDIGAFIGCGALVEVYNYSPSITVKLGETSFTNNGGLGGYAKVVYNADDLTGEKPETRITVVDNVQYYDYGDNFIALAPISRNVTIVSLDSRTTEINGSAFSDSSLTSITIPSSVTSIGEGAFQSCDSLTSIEVDPANTAYTSEDGVLFNKDKTILIAYPAGNTRTSYIIPSSVTSIGEAAFYRCSSLTSVDFGENSQLTSIGSSAFKECSNLTSITIPEDVTSIGSNAFFYCDSLTRFTINATTPPTLGLSVFSSDMISIYVPAGSVNAYKAASGWESYSSKISAIV